MTTLFPAVPMLVVVTHAIVESFFVPHATQLPYSIMLNRFFFVYSWIALPVAISLFFVVVPKF